MNERPGRAVILTALGLEYEAVRACLTTTRLQVHRSGTRYELGRLEDTGSAWEVVLAEIGEGNQGAAALTGQAIGTFNPDLVLFVGVAGSLVDSVHLGDIVAATRVDAYHGGKQVARRFLARPATWPAAWQLEQAARQVRRERRWVARLDEPPSQVAQALATRLPEVHLKPILAGEVVLDSRESRLYRFLREHYNDAVAIEMEGAGLASTAHASGAVPAMVVRGISDLAGGAKAASDKAGWQPVAARHAAAFTVELLAALDPKELSRPTREEEDAEIPGPAAAARTEDVRPDPPTAVELRGHERPTRFENLDQAVTDAELRSESAAAVRIEFGRDPRDDYEQLGLDIALKFTSGSIPDYSEGMRILRAKRDGVQLWWETVNYSVSNDHVEIIPLRGSATVIRRLPSQFHGFSYYELRLPHALQDHESHRLWVRKQIHDRNSEPYPIFYCSARRSMVRTTVRVEFALDALPKRVLRFVAPTSRMPEAADSGQPVRVETTGVVEEVFKDLIEGISYGLRWFW
jgi:nucleoside phosphorylase